MCEQCVYQGNRYEFLTTKLNLTDSQKKCEEDGGSLAKHLDEQVYIELNKCCHNGKWYRIGLIADSKCEDTTPFRWIDEDSCRDASPWQNINPSTNCQTITILLASNINNRLPSVKLDKCIIPKPYICQYPQEMTKPTTQIKTIKTTTQNPITSTSATKTTRQSAPATRTTISTTNKNPTTPATTTTLVTTDQKSTATTISSANQSLYSTKKTTHTDSLPLEARYAIGISGAVCGILILIMLLAVGVKWYKKKVSQKNMKNMEIPMSSQPSNDIQHHVYDHIADRTSTTQAHKSSVDEDEHGYVTANSHPIYLTLHDPGVSEAYSNHNELCGSRAMANNTNTEKYANINANFAA